MEPRSGRRKATIRWSALHRRWMATYADHTHLFVKWDNALYFANYAVATDRRVQEWAGHDAE